MVDDFDLDAAALRAGTADLPRFVEVLAGKLEQTLPAGTSVTRRPVRRFSREKRVTRLDVTVGDDGFALHRDDDRVVAVRRTVVRGIAIRNDELPVADWIAQLADAVSRQAGEASDAHRALTGLLD